jgi:RNA polymerase sigma-70 factor (ECF subfamily)
MDDAALLRAAVAGDAHAYTHFMRAHQAAVHRYLVALMGTGADAEDALQETFINAWRGADSYAATGSARGWLYAIARNVVRHQLRRHVGEPAHVESLDALAEEAGWGCVSASSENQDAERARETIAEALPQLPADEREVLTLRELDGWSGHDTAALLGITLPAMKSRLHRARLHLAAAVRALDSTSPGRPPHA